jgi:dihydrofolate reductase
MVYTALASLDGYIEDEDGKFDWAAPDEEVHAFVNDLARPAGIHLYGRRMYETMTAWETVDTGPDESPAVREFAEIWRAVDKIVYSRTLDASSTARTTVEREFDPEAVRALKDSATSDVTVAGPELAAHAFRAGLVDECHLFLAPVIVGGGKPALPAGIRIDLDLLDERRFGNGTVFLRYGKRA